MKKIRLVHIMFFLTQHTILFAQNPCEAENLSYQCISKLQPGFNFLRKYKIEGDGVKDSIEYSYVFSQGTHYMLTLCAESQNNNAISISLFDSNRNLIASSTNNNQTISAIAYHCKAAGIYYIQYRFEKSKSSCGGSVLGFKRI